MEALGALAGTFDWDAEIAKGRELARRELELDAEREETFAHTYAGRACLVHTIARGTTASGQVVTPKVEREMFAEIIELEVAMSEMGLVL